MASTRWPTLAGPLNSHPRRFLKAFFWTWFSGDRAGMVNFAAPQTLSEPTTLPSNCTGYRINWRPDDYCYLGSSGGGGCTFTLAAGATATIDAALALR